MPKRPPDKDGGSFEDDVDKEAERKAEADAFRKGCKAITGNRKQDRQEMARQFGLVGLTMSDIALSIRDAVQNGSRKEQAEARSDFIKIGGLNAPAQLELEANDYENMGYDELVVSVLTDMADKGRIATSVVEDYEESIKGKKRLGGMLLDADEIPISRDEIDYDVMPLPGEEDLEDDDD